jgi:adenine-specific DNA-methyltransferase
MAAGAMTMTAMRWPTGALHPVQRRYLVEDLVRLRRSDEPRRYAAPQRAAKVDANPHQIEAVVFALARLREGGCILADEVGLGKTIEAGLVVAQLLAEGARRVLLIAPKALLGQWRTELFTLFGLEAVEGTAQPGGFEGDGIFVIGREAAGSETGHDALMASGPFDLCIIDEAHEVFAAIYKRFDKFGGYDDDAPAARTAGRVRDLLVTSGVPVLLLTATPIQNNLAELWGLVQYVDPTGTLLGDLPTFREVFCESGDRQLVAGQEDELRSRLRVVIQRTLRRQAQEFLEQPFVRREARLFEYAMSPAERSLYDDVTRYLLEPGIVAFQGKQRQLLLLGFHRRMASSTRALAASLERVAARLRRKLTRGDPRAAGKEDAADAAAFLSDLEDEDAAGPGIDVPDPDAPPEPGGHDEARRSPSDPVREPEAAEFDAVREPEAAESDTVKTELLRVESYVRRAGELGGDDGKFRDLLKAIQFVAERGQKQQGSGKLVIFTESRVTMTYLRDRLVESRWLAPGEITLFSGVNDSKQALAALARWRDEMPPGEGRRPSEEIAVRLALVHEFETRSRVFISTEAGAKGLNLQFCDTVVNYDLPWNPQRIEQRIGRCHRYKQKHDPVTVINFLAKDNVAQRLTFQILSEKLELFGTVLDASDQVLHRSEAAGQELLVSALGADLETELRRIYDRARTLDEVTAELRALREKVEENRRRFEQTHQRTAGLIESQFDDGVKQAFRARKTELPEALAVFDADLARVVTAYRCAAGIPSEPLELAPAQVARDAGAAGNAVAVTLHLTHPLVVAAVDEARRAPLPQMVIIELPPDAGDDLSKHAGRRGRLRLVKVLYSGFERVEQLVPVAVLEDTLEVLAPGIAHGLLRGTFREPDGAGAGPGAVGPAPVAAIAPAPAGIAGLAPVGIAGGAAVGDDVLADATEEVLFALQGEVDRAEHDRFERASQQAESFLEDRILVLRRRRDEAERRLERAIDRRDGATGSESRTAAERQVASSQEVLDEITVAIERLERKDDVRFQKFREHIHERRYAPPRVEHLFDVQFAIQ